MGDLRRGRCLGTEDPWGILRLAGGIFDQENPFGPRMRKVDHG